MSDFNYGNGSVSSILRDNGSLNVAQKQALLRSFRSVTGQFKLADTSVVSSTFVVDTEFSFGLKKGTNYILEADLNFRVGGAAGPLGGLKVEFLAPGNSTISAMEGFITYTLSGSAPVLTALGTATDTPYTGMVKGLNTSITLDSASTADGFANVKVYSLLQPSADDLLTFEFGQVATSAGHATVLLAGSSMKLMALSSSRKAPNAI